MRINTTTTMARRRRAARRRVIAAAIGICALAMPASAGWIDSDHTAVATAGGDSASQLIDGWSYSALHSAASRPSASDESPGVDPDYKAVFAGSEAAEPTLVSSPPASGFDWGDAALGAAAAMALVALAGAAILAVRRRTAMSPSTASTS